MEYRTTHQNLGRLEIVLVETCETNEGFHCFVYPFEGRLVHEGLASLLAWRWGRVHPCTFSIAVNDYGFELLTADAQPWTELLRPAALGVDNLVEDILASVNAGALTRKRFRDVARIAGFIHPGLPYAPKGARQLHASAGLLFDVLRRYDPEHLLLGQARREVVEQHFAEDRLIGALARLAQYEYPGNVRELKHVVERSAYMASDASITLADIDAALPSDGPARAAGAGFVDDPALSLEQRVDAFEAYLCRDALGRTRFVQKEAAALLGLTYDQFRQRYRKYGLGKD